MKQFLALLAILASIALVAMCSAGAPQRSNDLAECVSRGVAFFRAMGEDSIPVARSPRDVATERCERNPGAFPAI